MLRSDPSAVPPPLDARFYYCLKEVRKQYTPTMLSRAPRPPRPLMLSVSPQDSEQWPLQIGLILPLYPALVLVFLLVPSITAQGYHPSCLILIAGPSVVQAVPSYPG